MEKLGSQDNEFDVEQLLADYAATLGNLPSGSKLSSRQVLQVLRSRDRLQNALARVSQLDDEFLAKLVDLDLKLKQKSDAIGNAEHLEQLRQSLQPPESSWWWYLDPPTKPLSLSDRFDWLWNVSTVVCLVLATSFATQTAKAFSTEGFDFLGTLSTIAQGAGLAFVAGGALTDKGKQAVAKTLTSVKIPASLHAEATFGASLLLLGTAYGINQNLHLVSNWYFEQAQRHEQQGEWSQAFKSYQRSLNFSPDDYKTQIAIGFLYEKLGNFERAIEEYKKGAAFGIPEFLNARARAMLMGELQKNDWQGGIDPKIVREAEDLLDRAERSNRAPDRRLSESSKDKRLHTDIRINQVIAKMASIKFEEKLSEKTQTTLNEIVASLNGLKQYIKSDPSEEQNPLTAVSTLGRSRVECFYQKAFEIGSESELPNVDGIDYLVQQQEIQYACSPFSWGKVLATTPDAFLLRKYRFAGSLIDTDWQTLEVKDIPSFMNFIYSYPVADEVGYDLPKYANRVVLIQDSETWLRLADRLSQLIQKNYVKGDNEDNKKIVWRFLVSQNGRVISYFAYDEFSRERGNAQSFLAEALKGKTMEKLSAELLDGGQLEFADFKVVLSPNGKLLHISP